MSTPRRRGRRRGRVVPVLVVAGIVLVVVAALVFQPWKLVVNRTVDEAAPVAATSGQNASRPVVLARGTFVGQEHDSSGSVELLWLADGSRVLRLTDLRTSNGPVLKVWLSDAAVVDGPAGWSVFDDGRYLDLGDLKGNIGSSNYAVPADADLGSLRSVSIWCARFRVSFAGATLTPVAP